MRSRLLMLCLAAALPGAALAHDRLTRKDIEGDLVLHARLTTAKQVQPGQRIAIEARIVNGSTNHTHKLVRPGDGSEAGWREPHVFLTAEHLGPDGKWRKVTKRGLLRCGNYDADWHDEVFELGAGKATEFAAWFPPPAMVLDLSKAGRYRIVAHYAYSARPPSKDVLAPNAPPGGLGRMKGVPAFELRSKPVELVVARDVEVHVEVVGKIRSKTATLLSALVEVRVSNETRKPIEFRPHEWTLQPQFAAGGTRVVAVPGNAKARAATLRAGETEPVLGKGRLAAGRDFRVTTDLEKGFVEVAFLFGRPGGAQYTSAFVKIPVAD